MSLKLKILAFIHKNCVMNMDMAIFHHKKTIEDLESRICASRVGKERHKTDSKQKLISVLFIKFFPAEIIENIGRKFRDYVKQSQAIYRTKISYFVTLLNDEFFYLREKETQRNNRLMSSYIERKESYYY
jgi:hypothetical protein